MQECGPTSGTYQQSYPGDAQRPDVLAVGRGTISGPPGPSQQAAKALDADATVDGVLRRGWGPNQPSTGVIITHGFHHGGDHSSDDSEDSSQADGGEAPLSCRGREHEGRVWAEEAAKAQVISMSEGSLNAYQAWEALNCPEALAAPALPLHPEGRNGAKSLYWKDTSVNQAARSFKPG